MILCKYGCGNAGVFALKNFYSRKHNEHCCSKNWTNCPANREKAKITAKKRESFVSEEERIRRKKLRLSTLSLIGSDGLSGFSKNAEAVAKARRLADGTYSGTDKMVRTKRSTKDAAGNDIYQQTAIKTAITRFGIYAGLKDMPEYKLYKYWVNRITKQQPLKTLKHFEKRAAFGRSNNPYQLDHKFSISQGFLNNIPPYIIGHISNLEMLPSKDNNAKGSNCSITKEALFEGFFSFD